MPLTLAVRDRKRSPEPPVAISRAASAVAVAALVALPGCDGIHITFLDPQGPVAAQQRTHFLIILGMMAIIVLPVLVLTPWLAFRYRYGKHNAYKPDWNFSWKWEVLLWGTPAVIVVVLGVFLWRNTIALDPYKPLLTSGPPIRVQAIGYDWKWLFIYPDLGIATVDELAFPVGGQLALDLTSQTVMQAFFVPALGSQIYAMSGMVTHLHLAADAPGRFRGRNTQYNGMDFAQQRFEAVAMRADDFDAWVQKVREAGPLDSRARAILAAQNTAQEAAQNLGVTMPLRFGSVPPDMFVQTSQPVAAAKP